MSPISAATITSPFERSGRRGGGGFQDLAALLELHEIEHWDAERVPPIVGREPLRGLPLSSGCRRRLRLLLPTEQFVQPTRH
jgi:hypothetical protein